MLLPGRKVTFFSKARSLALGCVAFATLTAARVSSDEKASYAPGQAIPVSCLNRTMYVLAMPLPELLYTSNVQLAPLG